MGKRQSKRNSPEQLEAETGLEPAQGDVYPNATVKVSRDQYSTFEIKRMVEETREIQLAPPFQRGTVWKAEQKCELIESILMGIPIPVVYVFEDNAGIKQMVDGRQRIGAIIDYMNGRFALKGLRMLPSFDGKRFTELEPLYRSKIERYQVPVYVIEPPTPERVKYDIFDRVNRGGTSLNNQEMRNALYQGPATRLLEKLAKTESFLNATGHGIKSRRMRDRYVILRFLGFYLARTGKHAATYRGNIDDFLAETMKYLNGQGSDDIPFLEEVFNRSMDRSYRVLGGDAFRFPVRNSNRRPINMALFEVLAYLCAIMSDPCFDTLPFETIRSRIKTLKAEFDTSGNFQGNVDSTPAIEYRFGSVESLVKEFVC
jgi:hypothetical protein